MTSILAYSSVPFGPARASTTASQVDALFIVEALIAAFFTGLIFIGVVYFSLRYRRQSDDEVPPALPTHYAIEVVWTVVPLLIMLGYFFWGAHVYINLKKPITHPDLEIHVLGKQWMWKIEHAGGVREINEIHVPVGKTVKLIISSQDVIHDLFIPEFRIKQDVIPGSFVTEWFQATRVGEYHLFCSQYCGTDHARMVGRVIVMQQADYQAWLAGAVPADAAAASGAKLFMSYGCVNCHGQYAPTMAGLYGSQVPLQDGSTVTADEAYLRESILNPAAKIVRGYPPIMPSYQWQVTDEEVDQLIEYIKSLQHVRNVGPAATQPLVAPSTQPAPGGQPGEHPNFPPAQTPYPPPPGLGTPGSK